MSGPAKARPPRASDPYGVGPVGSWIAPVLAIVGLLLIAVVTLNLLQGEMPFGIGGGGSGNGNGNGKGDGDDPDRTPAPSNIVVVPEEATFEGSIVYAKAGNIWIQTDDEVRQLTAGRRRRDAVVVADGQWVYYIHTVADEGKWPAKGVGRVLRPRRPAAHAHPSGRQRRAGAPRDEQVQEGQLTSTRTGSASRSSSPDGSQIARRLRCPEPRPEHGRPPVLGPEPRRSSRKVDVGVKGVLGHQDPEWRPDGKFLLYVRNGRDGSRGAPVIMRYNMETGKAREMTGAGYLQPAYSPDGKYIAATKTSALGSDVVILDGATGEELLRVTDDDASWSPVWSPAGDGDRVPAHRRPDGGPAAGQAVRRRARPGRSTRRST